MNVRWRPRVFYICWIAWFFISNMLKRSSAFEYLNLKKSLQSPECRDYFHQLISLKRDHVQVLSIGIRYDDIYSTYFIFWYFKGNKCYHWLYLFIKAHPWTSLCITAELFLSQTSRTIYTDTELMKVDIHGPMNVINNYELPQFIILVLP